MAKNLFLVCLFVCLVCIALVQIDDVGVFGIHEEPETILFYGGLGLLAGLSGLVAAGSGLYWFLSSRKNITTESKQKVRAVLLIVLAAMLVSLLVRLVPAFAA